MAKFINTPDTISQLEKLIKNTSKTLVLVTPYLQLTSRIKDYLEVTLKQGKNVKFILRDEKNKLSPEDIQWLNEHKSVTVKYCKNLHAKCYFNETEAIITSMNLYAFSEVNNHEMGVHLLKSEDPQIFNEILEEVNNLLRISEASASSKADSTGFCIRTGKQIPFNVKRPFSAEAFSEWNKYGDEFYPEKYCHYSGEKSHGETCFDKPILSKNWKKAKEKFNLA